jgi:hypothetical protein
MSRLQKFIEKGAYGEGPLRIAYALGAEKLPPSLEGAKWHIIDSFNAGEEILKNPSLKLVFQVAIKDGCAVLPAQSE